VFNIQGSEMVFLLLIALIILGPEKLPDAIRKFGRAYSEFKKMANGFQGELKSALDEPMRELRETADAMKSAADFDMGGMFNTSTDPATTAPAAATPPPIKKEEGLNFGSLAPRRADDAAAPVEASATAEAAAEASPKPAGGLNFGSSTPRTARAPRDPLAPVEDGTS
jgi:sec-independent protein translocase protein TatB